MLHIIITSSSCYALFHTIRWSWITDDNHEIPILTVKFQTTQRIENVIIFNNKPFTEIIFLFNSK